MTDRPRQSPPSRQVAVAATNGSAAFQSWEPSQSCSWAACREASNSIVGEWWFCDRHARQHEAMESGDDQDDDPLDGALIDETAVERRCAGDRTVTLNRAEAYAAFARLELAGMSASEIGDRLGTTPRTVARWRGGHHTAYGLPGVSMTTPTASGIGLLLEQASGHGSSKVQRLGNKIEGLLDDLRALIKASEAQEETRQEVARLERQLAEAKAKLRGKPVAVRAVGTGTGSVRNTEPLPCRKGCGRVAAGAQGRAAHERNCQHVAVAS